MDAEPSQEVPGSFTVESFEVELTQLVIRTERIPVSTENGKLIPYHTYISCNGYET